MQQVSNSKQSWLVPFTCLLAGGALIGISTNLAKYAGEVGLTPLAFLFSDGISLSTSYSGATRPHADNRIRTCTTLFSVGLISNQL